MKKISMVIPLLLGVSLLSALVISPSEAKKNKRPKTWENRKSALKPVPQDQKDKVAKALPETATAEPKKARRMLVFYRCEGYIHKSISIANHALEEMGTKTNAYSVDLADAYSALTAENLKQYDVLLFNNTTRLVLKDKPEVQEAIKGFLADGKGVVGIHAASDNFGDWDEGVKMMGGLFDGHPWNSNGNWAMKLDDPEHVLNKAFAKQGFWIKDEIYQCKEGSYSRDQSRVLFSIDMSKPENLKVKGLKREDNDYAVSWIHEFNGGRVYYSNLGHNEGTFWNEKVLKHYLDGIQYAAGDLEADATPSAKLDPQPEPALAPKTPEAG